MKNILLLEDEFDVIEIFIQTIKINNSNHFTKDQSIEPLSLTLDNGSIWKYDLSRFDMIFIDRDNFLDERNNNYHENFLNNFGSNYWYNWNLWEIVKNIYPMSWNNKNNEFLVNQIVKILENTKINNEYKTIYWERTYYIESRQDRIFYENLLLNNIITKSFPCFQEKIKEKLLNL